MAHFKICDGLYPHLTKSCIDYQTKSLCTFRNYSTVEILPFLNEQNYTTLSKQRPEGQIIFSKLILPSIVMIIQNNNEVSFFNLINGKPLMIPKESLLTDNYQGFICKIIISFILL